jgi:hypothetical protein
LHYLLKDYKRRAKLTAPLRGGSRSGNICKAWRLKLNRYSVLGHVRASPSGHGLHTMPLSTLLADREAWEAPNSWP